MPKQGKRSSQARRLQEAADPTTPSARLVELCREELDADRKQSPVICGAAANPNLPPEILCFLFFDGPALQALKNPALPLYLLEDPGFLSRCDRAALQNLLREEDLPHFFLSALLAHREPRLATEAAQHVRLAGEAGAEWREEAHNVLRAPSLHLSPFLLELIELGLVPVEVAARAVGASSAYPVRQVLLRGATRNAAYRPLLDLLRKVTGTRDLRGRGAPDPEVDPEPLCWLAGNDGWLRRLAARHPRTPPHLLARLAEVGDLTVQREVAAHPATPPEVLADLAGSRYLRVRLAVARNPSAGPELLARLAEDPEARIRAAVGRHPTTPGERLTQLAGDTAERVRSAVARNPACPAEALIALASDVEPAVRLGAVRNPAAPAEVRKQRLDGEYRTRQRPLPGRARMAAGDPSIHGAVSHALPPGYEANSVAAGSLPSEPDRQRPPAERLQGLGMRRRREIAANPAEAAEMLDLLSQDLQWEVRAAVAGNPSAPEAALERLSQSSTPRILFSLAGNPRLTPEHLDRLTAQCWSDTVAEALVAMHGTFAVLECLAGAQATEVRLVVARKPELPPEILNRLAGDADLEVRRAVRRHPRRSAATEAALRGAALCQASEHGLDLCQLLALSHPEQPAEGLRKGAIHRYWECRLAVALNPKAGPELLSRLACDGNRLVRAAARSQLAGEVPPRAWEPE